MPETDPIEMTSSRKIFEMLEEASLIATGQETQYRAESGSKFANDDARIPTRPLTNYAHAQITTAGDCLQCLDRMIVRRGDNSVTLHLSPNGHYALIRNAMDSLATVLWLLQPNSSTGRIKRLLQLECNETDLQAAIMRNTSQAQATEWRAAQRRRIRELSINAGIAGWDPLHKESKLPTTTRILKDIDPGRVHLKVSWLSMWQLASGHAHGKRWAVLFSNELTEKEGTATDTGAVFTVTASYQFLELLLRETMGMYRAAVERYRVLSRAFDAGDQMRHPTLGPAVSSVGEGSMGCSAKR